MSEQEELYESESTELDAEDFLDLVWGDRPGWVDLPTKVGHYWVAFYTEWPSDAGITRRIDSALRDREDIYYSVAQFSKRGRRIEDVLAAQWLWADLDEVHPTSAAKLGFLPTLAVESSPGRYQALWRLDSELGPKALEKLNRGLSYALDADRGGWDLTQVLRIPGTRNFKYPEAPMVKLLWHKPELVYNPAKIWKVVKEIVPHGVEGNGAGGATSIPSKAIPRRAKELLKAAADQVVEGERSARLWELECLLAESGLDEEAIFELVRGCAWNKWRGSGEAGRRRLRGDIHKAMAHVVRQSSLDRRERRQDGKAVARHDDKERVVDRDADKAPDLEEDGSGGDSEGTLEEGAGGTNALDDRLPFVGYASFMAMAMEEPKWLIENIWTAGSQGFIAGEPKTNKTTLALALALSVASGSPFLGKYAVGVTGPVLFVQEENAPWMMQDRLRKLAVLYGLISRGEAHVRTAGAGALGSTSVDLDFPVDVPLRLLNNYGFDLGVDEHREMLLAEVDETRPKLLILDPLYLIIPADTNNADDLRSFLKWIIRLRYEYDCAVMIVHHMRKQSQGSGVAGSGGGGGGVVRPGQRILGSTILHGFSDSALYTSAREESREGWVRFLMETEFRSMAPQSPIDVALSMSAPGGLDMTVEIGAWSLEALIMDIVREEPGVTVVEVCKRLEVDKRTVLARVRGGDMGIMVEEAKKGRGKSHQLFPPGTGEGLRGA